MLDRTQGTPLHHQAYLIVRDAIRSGRYRPGDALPTEEAFAAEFGVSRITIRRALEALAQANLIDRQQGRGTFVRRGAMSAPVEVPIYSMIEQISRIGATTEVRVLEFGDEVPSPEIRAAFGIGEGEALQRCVRVRLQNGEPLLLLTTFVGPALGAGIRREDMERHALFELIRRAGLRIASGEQTVSAALASPVVAQRLDIKIGAPLISVTRMMKDNAGKPVEYLQFVCSPERFQLRFSLRADDFAEIERRFTAPPPPEP
jgi:GntR family transcriptional regulator